MTISVLIALLRLVSARHIAPLRPRFRPPSTSTLLPRNCCALVVGVLISIVVLQERIQIRFRRGRSDCYSMTKLVLYTSNTSYSHPDHTFRPACLLTTPFVSHLTPTLSLNTVRTSSKRNKERLWPSLAAERSGTWRLERRLVTLLGWYSREGDRTSEFCLSKSIAMESASARARVDQWIIGVLSRCSFF